MEEMLKKLGHSFKNPKLLDNALRHRSSGKLNNERFEFLGDSILNFVTAELIFENFPTLPEGNMSRVRAALVNQETLVKVAQEINLAPFILVNYTDNCKETTPSIIADAMEAVFAAIYLDAGIFVVSKIIKGHLIRLLNSDAVYLKKDHKTMLQEILQRRGLPLPAYALIRRETNGGSPTIEVECIIEKLNVRTRALGSTKKQAETLAAEKAIQAVG